MSAHRQSDIFWRRGLALTVALAVCSTARVASADDKAPASAASSRTALHQEIRFKASPERLYEILLSSQLFTAFSGLPATIDPNAGGAFSLFGGRIVGRNIEVVPSQRLVQAWRPADWPPGLYSLVHIELKPQGAETLLVLDHSSFPAGGFDHLSAGWMEHYWEPLTKFLAAAAPAAH
jgi:activator of HSP90 ATPase